MPQLSLISGMSKQSFYLNLVAAPEREMSFDRTREFLLAILDASANGGGEIEAVYRLLVENLELLELHFIYVLRHWARQTFALVSKQEKAIIARTLVDLARIIWALPEGEPDVDLEIAIACNELALEAYNLSEFPELWATVHNNLALAYSERCFGDTVENDLKSYAHHQQAQLVFTYQPFPEQWAKSS